MGRDVAQRYYPVAGHEHESLKTPTVLYLGEKREKTGMKSHNGVEAGGDWPGDSEG